MNDAEEKDVHAAGKQRKKKIKKKPKMRLSV